MFAFSSPWFDSVIRKRGPSARREFYVPYNHNRQVTREKVKIAFKGK
jgi:hypothetical protein